MFKLGLVVLIRTIYIRFHTFYFHLINDVLETSKLRAMFYNILSQIFIVKCFTKSLLLRTFIFIQYFLNSFNLIFLCLFKVAYYSFIRVQKVYTRNGEI